MVKRPGLICGALLASLLLHAAAAYGAPGDPEAGSPSGGVYELPLEAGREDAAPGSGGTTAPETGGGGGTGQGSGSGEGGGEAAGGEGEEAGSNYRSENNFGSSSQVPGTGAGGAGTGGAAAGAAGGGGSGDGAGGAAGGGGGSGAELDPTAAEVPDTGNTSVAGNLALLATILVLAALVGVFVARRRLRTR
jgi:hypothetical protein